MCGRGSCELRHGTNWCELCYRHELGGMSIHQILGGDWQCAEILLVGKIAH